jgi:hypothetical protein
MIKSAMAVLLILGGIFLILLPMLWAAFALYAQKNFIEPGADVDLFGKLPEGYFWGCFAIGATMIVASLAAILPSRQKKQPAAESPQPVQRYQ